MGNPQPLVSVILPFYNAPFLKESIQSILDQSYENYELILVNNASSDKSVSLIQPLLDHPKIKYIIEKKRGVVHAFNAGLNIASGQYIARMDADDISYPDRLKLQVALLEQEQSIGLVSGLVKYLGDPENRGFIEYVSWLNSIQTEDQIRFNQFVEFPMANPTLMIRRSIFDRYGSYQEGTFPEDYEYFLRLMSNGIRMAKVNQNILKWRDTELRLTRTESRYSQDAFFRIKAKYLAIWLEKNNPFHPHVFIWGAGRVSRRRSDYLMENGIEIVNYIDVKKNEKVLHYLDTPSKEKAFIVSYVANRGARDEIRSFLCQRGYQEEVNFIVAS